ncbi:heparinase II/III family protein [Galbibacter sp. EGI 63066]|uniref:heparinase II/III family protein n=1 Tax=Galbibacter sp. EGI 63066 TaxID=2993559 RepID=UPI00224911DD|nr:heparinase II/III family protein [Galbibacter sp. EGI 63066]MCX2678672.1 heparinase II/III family protein [Galbibacter sp. EGI 63066]
MKKLIYIFFGISLMFSANAQLPVPNDVGKVHPRCFGSDMSRDAVQKLVANKEWAAKDVKRTEERLAKYLDYCEKEPDWLLSRLQMYWKTKSTQVYINGGRYHHAEGEAPVPTVRFPGTRDHRTNYFTPSLKDIKPYMDDERGLYLQRRDNKQWEWTDIPSSARIVESINRNILGIARDAAFMYWYTGEDAYAQLAYGVLDTYLTGLYYRTGPIDLSHGHHQTLVGLTSFEVIQEHYIAKVTQAYDFLHGYLSSNHPNKIALYSTSLQKWADQVIKNGVSFNNWNLFQAGHVSRIALVLENDSVYENRKGAQYYLDQIMNRTSTRQWSMQKLIDYGYGVEGIWNESPGYSLGVLRDFIHFSEFYDRTFDIDLIKELPILRQAVLSATQYLYPNGFKVAFGDGHYGKLQAEPVLYMIKNAKKFGKEEDEILFTRLLKTLFDENVYAGEFKGKYIEDLFTEGPLKVREDIKAGKLEGFTSPLFYTTNSSWLVQRQGEGDTGLMISQIGSKGNHMHSNGIAMELYGRGLPLAPEMGHGSSYFSIEYAEYYTQFPAHNTVIVNGRSKYPEMKSNHAFNVVTSYPKSGKKEGNVPGITFSDVEFLEPETNSNQRRVMGIIKHGEEEGYYIDVFRSKQKDGNDIKHEYFYHNLGQELRIVDKEGEPLDLQPTNKLAFGDGDLMAYDYLWDKKSIKYDRDFKGQFNLNTDDRGVSMNLWMQGSSGRELFSVLSPKSTAFRHGILSKELADKPIPTLVVRQEGEAWKKPFVAIYEPALNGDSNIRSVDYFGNSDWVGIQVNNESEIKDFIFSSSEADIKMQHHDIIIKGTYGVVSYEDKNNRFSLFLGNGKSIQMGVFKLEMNKDYGTSALVQQEGGLYLTSEAPVILTLPINNIRKQKILIDKNGRSYKGKTNKRAKTVSFKLPKLDYGPVKIIEKN